ncbi:discoidin domain-containing protein [Micromonospora sp. NPDC005215]|uniref:discoidin domain-containing protein n=1 Tax=Micromonospora sp. NPDC005215 TaxID=3157024 RepID=UPI0033A4787F
MNRTLPPSLTPLSRAGRGRRLAALGSALLLLLGAYLAILAPPADAADALLSQGRPVTASSTESVAFPASAAVDGNAGTRWSSAFSDPQWLRVDLGVSATVSRVVLRWEAAYARAFTIQTSPTGTDTWTTIHTTTAGAGGVQDLAVTGTGRFVRVNTTQRATQYGVSLWEFEVYGSTGPPPTTPPPTTRPPTTPPPGGATLLSYAKPAVASTSQNDGACFGCTPDKAFDYDPASRWATSPTNGWVDPGWIYVDLGATATVTQVVLQWDPAYARSYQIQVSPNASTWTTVYSTTTGKGFKETIDVTGTGRYVRMYGTARSSQYGYSLWEFKVYGTGGNPTPPPTMPPDPTFPATRLVFADEFNGAVGGKPDPAKWTIDPGTGQNNELQYYTNNDNASLDGAGSLVIEARRETVNGRSYTSHRMNTANKFHVQYGRIEARIRVPKGNGLWPAFWMMGADFLTGRPWPYNGEIDIMEVLGRNTQEAYSTLHAPAYNGGNGYGQKYPSPGGVDLSGGFHVWSAEWDSRGITFKIDGQTVFVASKATVESTRGPWVFDHPFYLILNLAVGGDFPGPVDGTTPFPSRMLVDYVRVYQ